MANKKILNFDYPLLIIVAALLILGILILVSVSADFSQKKFGQSSYYFLHQLIFGIGIGILLGIAAYKVPLVFLKKWAWLFVLINLILMILVFIPGLGIKSGGASRWINFGFFTFQPSEILKLTFIIYLSAWLAVRTESKRAKKEKRSWKFTLVPFLLILGFIIVLLQFQSDASTLALIFAIAFLLYFLSQTPLWHNLLIFLFGLAGFALLIVFSPYRVKRIFILLGLLEDPMGAGYQVEQALITIGSGGIKGLGLGMSNQKLGFLPQTMSDSIFAVFAEEMGFIWVLILVVLFLLFLWRGFKIAKKSQDSFLKLCAAGISFWICVQAFINIGAMIEVMPLTGIPLPFMSYGGSHIMTELIAVGLLLNISKSLKK